MQLVFTSCFSLHPSRRIACALSLHDAAMSQLPRQVRMQHAQMEMRPKPLCRFAAPVRLTGDCGTAPAGANLGFLRRYCSLNTSVAGTCVAAHSLQTLFTAAAAFARRFACRAAFHAFSTTQYTPLLLCVVKNRRLACSSCRFGISAVMSPRGFVVERRAASVR